MEWKYWEPEFKFLLKVYVWNILVKKIGWIFLVILSFKKLVLFKYFVN